MKVPEIIRRKLYVRGSLRRTPNGFEFLLKNTLGSGYTTKLLPLQVNGHEVHTESTSFYVDHVTIPFASITEENPFTLAMNKDIKIEVKGTLLTEEEHKIRMGFMVKGLGLLEFTFTDREV